MPYSIGVIGTGYVGLVTGTCLADVGNTVLCIDVDAEKVARLTAGDPVIFERGLDSLIDRNVRERRLRFSLDLAEAVRTCSILMFCLPTPPGKDGTADLDAVMHVANQVADLIVSMDITESRIIANKSTVPVGTTALVTEIFMRKAPGRDIHVVSNPEFLSEGYAVDDFMNPDRVVIGTSSAYAKEIMTELYQPFVTTGAPIYCFDEPSAEVAKYAANSFLATRISFMNDLSEYCEVVGADIEQVRLGMGSDPRIGRRFLFAGIGYGGSCFPKDVMAIALAAKNSGVQLEVIEAAQQVNKQQVERFIQRIVDRFGGSVTGRRFALWGLAFKPNTDDVRDAPAFVIIRELVGQGAVICAFDPEAIHTSRRVLGDLIEYAENMYGALNEADALIIATEWNEFRSPSFERMHTDLLRPLVFDGRNIYNPEEMLALKFEYHSVGRPSVVPGELYDDL